MRLWPRLGATGAAAVALVLQAAVCRGGGGCGEGDVTSARVSPKTSSCVVGRLSPSG